MIKKTSLKKQEALIKARIILRENYLKKQDELREKLKLVIVNKQTIINFN